MLKKKLWIVLMSLMICLTSIAKSETVCDRIAKKCKITVEQFKKALKESEDVVKAQDALILEQKKEIYRAHKEEDKLTKWIIGSNLAWVLFFVIKKEIK